MSTDAPYFGIEFGTTNSRMAWYDPEMGVAEVLLNDHYEAKTPSLVYFPRRGLSVSDPVPAGTPLDNWFGSVSVGNPVEDVLLDSSGFHEEQRADVRERIVKDIRRDLTEPMAFHDIVGYGVVRPSTVEALILRTLKHDAEQHHFHEDVRRSVIACPAGLSADERRVLFEAATEAGFESVGLIDEPVAVTLAVDKLGPPVGRGALIFDLGGGTFDLSVVARGEDGTFYMPVEPVVDLHLGGEDFDLALYEHCDRIAREELGRPIDPEGGVDPMFLNHCRLRKESLSRNTKSPFSSFLDSEDGAQLFRYEVDRETFEELIRARVEETVRQTVGLWEQVKDRVDTVILTGGSSRIPLVQRMLAEALPAQPRNFADRGYAALGAAYHAYELWKPRDRHKPHEERAIDEREVMASPPFASAFESPGHEVSVSPCPGDGRYKLSRTLIGHTDTVASLAFSPDGKFLASGSWDETVKLWNPRIGEHHRTLAWQYEGRVRSIAFSPNGQLLASGTTSEFVLLWNPHTRELLRELAFEVGGYPVTFHPDGRILAKGSYDDIDLFDPHTGRTLCTLAGHSDWVESIAFSPDGQRLASGSWDGTVMLWDPSQGKPIQTLTGHSEEVGSIAFTSDGRFLASGSDDKTVRLWNSGTGELLRTLAGHSQSVSSVAFSPDGSFLASGSKDSTVKLWAPRTGELLWTLTGHSDMVSSVVFSPAGDLLASGSADNTIIIWGKG